MFTGVDPFTCSAGELLAELACLEPGLSVMSLLRSVAVDGLSPGDAVTYLQVHERCRSWWESQQVPAMVAAAEAESRVDEYLLLVAGSDEERLVRVEEVIREELACALRVSAPVMQAEIDTARLLSGPLAATGRAWELGQVTRRHVAVMAEAVRRLPGFWMRDDAEREAFAAACGQFQRRVLPRAAGGTVADTRRAARAAVLAIDGEGEARRRERAKAYRDAWLSPDVDGMSLLMARMATEDALAVMAQVDAAAHARQGAARANGSATAPVLRLGEHRVEALAALILGGGGAQPGPGGAGQASVRAAGATSAGATSADVTSAGAGSAVIGPDGIASAGTGSAGTGSAVIASGAAPVRAHVNLTIDLATLLGLRDAMDDGIAAGQVDLAGNGPACATLVRDLLANPDCAVTLRRLVTDPITGHLLDYGRRTYAIPRALRDYITARDKACRFPGCNRRADHCQIDHAKAWNDGGHTSPANLGALCTRHHQLKTHAGWDITDSRPDGSCTWTSPQGRRYDHHPPPIGTTA
jgi:hypothetical protein